MLSKKLCLLLFILSLTAISVVAQKIAAPELIGGKGWLNTDKPLKLAELKGKVVLLDFWTYGCINCIHIIPDLKKLEAKYKNELVVIGVHSGKFSNERETENIRRIILRYELEHPVVNDADYKIWEAYGVQAWPTQVLIDPAGEIVIKTTGEGQLNLLDQKIGETVSEFRASNKLDEKPLAFALEKDKTALNSSQPKLSAESRRSESSRAFLSFPGKVLADEKSNRLFIADSNHNRIVVTKLDGTLLMTIGSGKAALSDGDFRAASFHRPQGMALQDNLLYVADTENHAIRKVNLTAKTVETIAGTGEQGFLSEPKSARETALNSPWDLQLIEPYLFIAMAGSHQIWRINLSTKQIEVFAGSGREARIDGQLDEGAFAQPSGLASDGKTLFVADAESNIIRAIDLKNKTVKTLAGGDLFEFGDRDAKGDAARFQHPLGVAVNGKNIFVSDTYNHKIKILNADSQFVQTFVGDGKPGSEDNSKIRFYEPGGLSVAGNQLFVADTNNNAIRTIDLRTKKVSTFKITQPTKVVPERVGLH